MGLKESGLRGSLRNVSVSIDAIPDSAVGQNTDAFYRFDDDDTTATLTDLEGNHDGSIDDMDYVTDDDVNRVVGQFDISTSQAVSGFAWDSLSEFSIGIVLKTFDAQTRQTPFSMRDNNEIDIDIDDGDYNSNGPSPEGLMSVPDSVKENSWQSIVWGWDGESHRLSVDDPSNDDTIDGSSLETDGRSDTVGLRGRNDLPFGGRVLHLELSFTYEGSDFHNDFHDAFEVIRD